MDVTMKKAVYAGSFNPWHKGHQYIYEAGKKLFDDVQVIRAINPDKLGNVKIISSIPDHILLNQGVALGNYCKEYEFEYLLRGVRVASDYDYEFRMAAFNQQKFGLHTVFIPCPPELSHLNSSALRELDNLGIDIKDYLI